MRHKSLPRLRKSEVGRRKVLSIQTGQSLVEVIIAATVGILVVTALTFATLFSLRNANFAKNSAQATKLAQEGIEKLRTARNRDEVISGNLGGGAACPQVGHWNSVTGPSSNSIWTCQLYSVCTGSSNCYFRFLSAPSYELSYSLPSIVFPSFVEDPLGDGKFQRVVVLSDDSSSYPDQKTATVIVRWSDATGPHDSRLTTILRKL